MAQPASESAKTEDLAADYYRLAGELEALQRLLDPLESELLARMKDGDKVDIPGTTRRLTRRSRGVLDPDILEKHPDMKPTLWNSITKRVPYKVLIDAAIFKGKITPKMIKECSHRSKPWLQITK